MLQPKTIPIDRVRELLVDDGWCMQQKYDGERLIVTCRGGKLSAINRQRRNVTRELGDLAALEGVKRYPLRIKCAALGWQALCKALDTLKA